MQNEIRLLPNCLVKKKNLYCKREGWKKNCIGIVLQEKGVVDLVCIARGELYCKRVHVGWKIVLQYGGAVG